MPAFTANPFAQSNTSLSEIDSQKWFSPSFSKMGSLMMPPSWSVISTYLHCPTSQVDKSRQQRYWVNRAASGPVISTWRSTPTSHRIASLTRFQKFCSRSPKSRAIYMWLYTENPVAPQRNAASVKGDFLICVPKLRRLTIASSLDDIITFL